MIVPVAALHDSESLLSNMNLCKGPKVAKMHNLLHVPYAIKLRSTSGLHKLRYKSTFVCKEEVSVTGSKLLFSWSSTFSWDDPLLVQTWWGIVFTAWTSQCPTSNLMEGERGHTAWISFWIPKRQAISTDTSFEIKMMMKIYNNFIFS